MKAGDFIELDIEPLIQAKVDGVPVFDCHYGTSSGHYSIKIDRLLTNPQRGWLGEHACQLTTPHRPPRAKARTRWPTNGPPRWPRPSRPSGGALAAPAESPAPFASFASGARRLAAGPATTST